MLPRLQHALLDNERGILPVTSRYSSLTIPLRIAQDATGDR
jgi:hypothetical protein